MFGLAFLLILWVYITLLRKFVRSVAQKRKSETLGSDPLPSAMGFFVLIFLPAWYFFGFFLSGTYWEFKRLCETDTDFYVVSPQPTRTVFLKDCRGVQSAIWHGAYRNGVCMSGTYSGDPLLVTRKVDELPECRGPVFKECFDFEPTKLPVYAYDLANQKEERSSVLFASALVIRDFQFVDQEGMLLAYNRSYRHYPLGTGAFATIFGFASGQPPSTGCLKKLPPDHIQQIYPPIADNE